MTVTPKEPHPFDVLPAQAIDAVLLHPIYAERYTSLEHAAWEKMGPGDALGTDCVIQRLVTVDGRLWTRGYRGDGCDNEDWFGWHQPVLAPVSGTVVKVQLNPKTNEPGVMGGGIASHVVLKDASGLMVLLAHVDDVTVKAGQMVTAGQVIAKVGNNGQSRSPHIHVGAWRGETPLQIRFDQTRMQAQDSQ